MIYPSKLSKLSKRRGTGKKGSNTSTFNELVIVKYFMVFFFFIFVVGCVSFLRSTVVDGNRLLRGPPSYPYVFDSILDTENYVVKGGGRFSEWMNGDSPYGIHKDTIAASDEAARARREHVKASMKHAWTGYKKYAFGYDEVNPVSGGYNNRWAGTGTTLIDSLDTLWLMDMKDEFYEARNWVVNELNFEKDEFTSVFETTIRSLGGLLAAYDWSGEDIFLEKATDLGNRLFEAFNTPSGIPFAEVNLMTGKARNEGWLRDEVSLSAGTTLQVEFRYLAKATGIDQYRQKAERVFEVMKELSPKDGLYPATVVNLNEHARLGKKEPKLSFGSRADSFYEYMLKIWLQGNKTEQMYRDMYDKSIQGMHDKLLQKAESGLWYIAQSIYIDKDHNNKKHQRRDHHKRDHHKRDQNVVLNPSFDHLCCFMGGLLALGAVTDPLGLESERAQRDLKTGKALTYTCYQMYASTATGLSPEIVQRWESEPIPDTNAPYYMLRPEAVESFYILHQLTGDPVYREWGWEVFQSIEKFCKTPIAYGHYPNVMNELEKPEDNMESFFLGETLKYLYLLFDPDSEVDLEKHVFNTEAHPLRIFE